ncbi:PA4575 family protein [Marinimicrobium sp. C2-29]|uniref:PA4575 family protein n=1 Tax=Marinimicrobium sp. C2-29 TaxID=3139825 RepID=UPI003138A311
MRIQYSLTVPSGSAPLVLTSGPRRVEIHLRHDEAGLFALIAFAGEEGPPERTIMQGPFQSLEEAVGARRAIATPLLEQGYCVDSDTYPIWTLAAQRSINAVREGHRANVVNYRFDPKDVFLDW